MPASSRTMSDLHPELATRWRLSAQEFAKQFPNQPAPFLTCTYRNNADYPMLVTETAIWGF